MTISTRLRELADAIGTAAPGHSEEDRRVIVAVYDLLAAGNPVIPAAVAAPAGVDQRDVDQRLDAWPGVFRDDEGRVVGFWGLAIPEMAHRFRAEGGKPMYAWCALDPFLVVPVIGRPARVESKDPVTGETITMTVTPDGIRDLAPAAAVTTLLQPEGPFGSDVVETFCHFVLNFASRQSAKRWAGGRQHLVVVPAADAFEVGRRAWAWLRAAARTESEGGGEAAGRGEATDELAQRVRTAAFRRMLATGRPAPIADIAAATGATEPEIRDAVAGLVAAGRARTDEHGNVTAAAGLSVTATRHRIQTRRRSWWTNCAYDALGILGALGADGEITTSSPLTGQQIRVAFSNGQPSSGGAVLFLADAPDGCRPNDDWCPNVNLFEDDASATAWAKAQAITGRVVSLGEGTRLGTVEWRPIIRAKSR